MMLLLALAIVVAAHAAAALVMLGMDKIHKEDPSWDAGF